MKIAAAIEKMTDFYKGNIHDIYHFANDLLAIFHLKIESVNHFVLYTIKLHHPLNL